MKHKLFVVGLIIGAAVAVWIESSCPSRHGKNDVRCIYIDSTGRESVREDATRCVCMFEEHSMIVECKEEGYEQ